MFTAIHSFGRYVPRYRIKAAAIAAHWNRGNEQAEGLGIIEKTVPARDEDTFTLAWEAAKQAIETSTVDPTDIQAVFVGSESHPYAVKPTSGMLVSALRLNPFCHAADLEFACKAGTAAMQIVSSMVSSKQIYYGLAIGADTAQSKPGDALEYSAAAGSAAFLIGASTAKEPGLCRIDATMSYTTDTPDFWRSAEEKYPSHAGRFTGEPAYFHHIETITKKILDEHSLRPTDIDHVIFHMPNAKFPQQAGKKLGFSKEQMDAGFIVPTIGNTYSACSPLGLAAVLQLAKKDQRLLLVSYGSGAGSDAFLLTMMKDGVPLPAIHEEIQQLDYAAYLRNTKALA